MDDLVILDDLNKKLATITTPEEALELEINADTFVKYAQREDAPNGVINRGVEISVGAGRKGGGIIEEVERMPRIDNINPKYQIDISELQQLIKLLGNARLQRWSDYAVIPDERYQELWAPFKIIKAKEIATKGLFYSEGKKIKRAQIIKKIRSNALTINKGPFDVLIIDPPWPYGTEYNPAGRRAASPYPEMSIEKIIEMEDAPLSETAKKNCILWLWTTHKFMRFSFAILEEWGFRDVAILTWVKDRIGLGSWLRSQSEFCIMAVKGKPIVELKNQSTIIYGPLREHSRKPDSFYELVQSLCPGVIGEYFGREKRDHIIGVLSNE